MCVYLTRSLYSKVVHCEHMHSALHFHVDWAAQAEPVFSVLTSTMDTARLNMSLDIQIIKPLLCYWLGKCNSQLMYVVESCGQTSICPLFPASVKEAQ